MMLEVEADHRIRGQDSGKKVGEHHCAQSKGTKQNACPHSLELLLLELGAPFVLLAPKPRDATTRVETPFGQVTAPHPEMRPAARTFHEDMAAVDPKGSYEERDNHQFVGFRGIGLTFGVQAPIRRAWSAVQSELRLHFAMF